MLSILIPIYNIDCTPLVTNLVEQINTNNIVCEIICMDDASTTIITENLQLDKQSLVTYIPLKQNIGRSIIRNKLAEKAKFPWLLFLDADTLPTNAIYLKNYVNTIHENRKESVIFGGLAYREKDIINNSHLRYIYGKNRESNPSKTRNNKPYDSLLFSNTLIKKSIFEVVQFNNEITKYGHEDSLFSHDLRNKQIQVLHIDNPVYHTGLENDAVFIKKTRIAIDNLWNIYNKGLIKPDRNRLLSYYFKTKSFLLRPVFSKVYKNYHRAIEKKLASKNPSLFLFDIYKLSYLCYISYQ